MGYTEVRGQIRSLPRNAVSLQAISGRQETRVPRKEPRSAADESCNRSPGSRSLPGMSWSNGGGSTKRVAVTRINPGSKSRDRTGLPTREQHRQLEQLADTTAKSIQVAMAAQLKRAWCAWPKAVHPSRQAHPGWGRGPLDVVTGTARCHGLRKGRLGMEQDANRIRLALPRLRPSTMSFWRPGNPQ